MKYLCLLYSERRIIDALPQREREALVDEYFALSDELRDSGHYIAAEALQPVQTATTVRSRNGKLSTTDGPFAETKEQLGGFYLLEARDLNEAVRLASKIPAVRWGCVEVRPIMQFDRAAQPRCGA